MRARNTAKLLSEKTCLTWKLRYTTYNLVVVLQVLGKGGKVRKRKHKSNPVLRGCDI